MKPGAFSYEAPQRSTRRCDSLATWRDDAKIIAGGQSLAPMLNMRLARPDHLIDINGLADLGRVPSTATRLSIGALVRHHRARPTRTGDAATVPMLAMPPKPSATMPSASAERSAAAWRMPILRRSCRSRRSRSMQRSSCVRDGGPYRARPTSSSSRYSPPRSSPTNCSSRSALRSRSRARAGAFACSPGAPAISPSWRWRRRSRAARVPAIERSAARALAVSGRCRSGSMHLVPAEFATSLTDGLGRQGCAAAVAAAVEIEDNERTPVVFRRELVEGLDAGRLDERTGATRDDAIDATPVTLTVNARHATACWLEPRRLLSDVLREDCGLTGTHVGCEHGVCGACTVLVRRRAGALLPALSPFRCRATRSRPSRRSRRTASYRARCSRRCTRSTACNAASARRASS